MENSIANSSKPNGTAQELPAAAQTPLLERVAQGAHGTIDRLVDLAAPHAQRLEAGVSSANESLHERADRLRELGADWTGSVRSTVRERPLAALAAALTAGVFITLLLRSER
jgi:ElaB/YqjD/DUF883 family membrane-anchored ribosome-binding protein